MNQKLLGVAGIIAILAIAFTLSSPVVQLSPARTIAARCHAHVITDDNLFNEYHGTPPDNASPAGFFRLLTDR